MSPPRRLAASRNPSGAVPPRPQRVSARAVYDVGPGQPLAAIADVPWATLAPGDEVRIHWRTQPYREKWVIGRAGTAALPILVRGVLGPNGERPVVSGDGATTPDPLDYTGEQRGVLKIGTSNVPPDTLPAYLVIESLDVRSAHPSYSFTDDRSPTSGPSPAGWPATGSSRA